MLKTTVRTRQKQGINYLLQNDGRLKKFTPWLGDHFSFLYDMLMEKSIFPKKFGADLARHIEILQGALARTHACRVLELATGSGNAVRFLPNDNFYTGIDISPGLLRKAKQKLERAGFRQAQCYVVSADDLPFTDEFFDICLCNLSLNFFGQLDAVLREIARVLKPQAAFVCSVPVPERNLRQATIRGTLYSENELQARLRNAHFSYERIAAENGALLYFKARRE